jgi:hypothetical protein
VKKKLSGIGGWLIIPILVLLYNLYVFLDDIMSLYLPDIPTLWWAVSVDIVLIVLTALLLFSIFEKRKIVPLFYIWYIWIIFSSNLIILFMNPLNPANPFILIGSIIWTIYFRNSVRVKNTFVNKDYSFLTIKKIIIPSIVILLVMFAFGFLAIASDSFNIILQDSSYISSGYYESQGFEMYITSPISIDFISDNISDVYLLDSDNYAKLLEDVELEYIEGEFEILKFNKRGIFLDEGLYYFIISATNNSINYNLTISVDN